MQCLTEVTTGSFIITNPQPAEYTTCTYLIVQPPELAINAYALTAAQGLEIALAIGILWATAFTFRVVGQFLVSQSQNIDKE